MTSKRLKRTDKQDIGYHTLEWYGKVVRWRDNKTGQFLPIIQVGAVPVFVDVDPESD